ncbi:MAG: hypothetical protein J6W84_01685 [Bacteroidales bacterium]|nr:hypothetical protein [Bacteroidales bacterium]
MSIQVNDFQWEPGKNDAEYIKLLESSRDEWQKIAQKAIAKLKALSKAQEPVEPVVDIDTWKCGNCGHTLEHQELLGDNVLFHEQYNYCPECGRAVKWE